MPKFVVKRTPAPVTPPAPVTAAIPLPPSPLPDLPAPSPPTSTEKELLPGMQVLALAREEETFYQVKGKRIRGPSPEPAPDKLRISSTPRQPFNKETMCGAQLRYHARGRLCHQPKGAKTPHLGAGRCWLHGGLTPIRHGLNSLVKHGRLRDMMEQMKAIDHDIMDLTPEVQLLRAMTIDFVNRYDGFMEALEAWYTTLDAQRRAEDLPPVPRRYPALEDASTLLEAISRMVERMHKITREGSITLDVFRSLMSQMGVVVADCIGNETILRQIETRWSQILVNPKSFVRGGPTTSNELVEFIEDDSE